MIAVEGGRWSVEEWEIYIEFKEVRREGGREVVNLGVEDFKSSGKRQEREGGGQS